MTTCNCWVRTFAGFVFSARAHSRDCPMYRDSLDTPDQVRESDIRRDAETTER